ncbi:hypothetical protein XENORESO_003659 [Xenotaenia resolanae]|uniref:Uncharacterized protein n=1 Tax=Xenotaenia resolanae TaxID=208358 RepID=A0ABV0VLD5_9TELE
MANISFLHCYTGGLPHPFNKILKENRCCYDQPNCAVRLRSAHISIRTNYFWCVPLNLNTLAQYVFWPVLNSDSLALSLRLQPDKVNVNEPHHQPITDRSFSSNQYYLQTLHSVG